MGYSTPKVDMDGKVDLWEVMAYVLGRKMLGFSDWLIDLIWFDLIWFDLIWFDLFDLLIWFDLIWFDWFDLIDLIDLIGFEWIWFDWFDLIWFDVIWFDLIWFDWIDWLVDWLIDWWTVNLLSTTHFSFFQNNQNWCISWCHGDIEMPPSNLSKQD